MLRSRREASCVEKRYLAIDLKSFYASVECVERGLDPLTTNLLVADGSRTDKTICLAVSPSLKAHGIPSRARLFEAKARLAQVNAARRYRAGGRLTGESWNAEALEADPTLAVGYITAPPRMATYMAYSARVYAVYLKFVAPEDIHVYSVDEVFMDATPYLKAAGCDAREFGSRIVREVLRETGITATVGIGTNLYLCKVAMDIVAKKALPDPNGVRVAELDEGSYRETLWSHRPLTDFWRVGRGIASKLEAHRLFTMGDVARCSLHNERMLYRLFGVNAELLIDHAWGWEPCTLSDIKSYRPEAHSTCIGQVLQAPYPFEKARLIVREMADQLALDLLGKRLCTDHLTLTVGYDRENLKDPTKAVYYQGAVVTDPYGRRIPKHAHGTVHLPFRMTSASRIREALAALFDRIVDPMLTVRRITVAAGELCSEAEASKTEVRQLSLFSSPEEDEREEVAMRRERRREQAILDIKQRYGKNAVFRLMDLEEGATALERNRQIGGHKA